MRVLAAFAIAPMIVPLLLVADGYMFRDVVYVEFFFVIGGTIGYSFAAFFGLPAYFLYFSTLNPMRFLPFLWFILACIAGYFLLFGVITASQMGRSALLSATFLGNGAVFAICAAVSVAAFYLIAFHEFRKASHLRNQ